MKTRSLQQRTTIFFDNGDRIVKKVSEELAFELQKAMTSKTRREDQLRPII